MSFEDLFPDPFDQSCRKEMIIDDIYDKIKHQVRQSISDKIHEFKNLQAGDLIKIKYSADFDVNYQVKK